jgi:hypothetical protein
MKNLYFIALFAINFAYANPGDTTKIRVFNEFHKNRYGNFDQWAVIPSNLPKSNRIWLTYTLGCLSNGQCEWDYTIKLYARERTGQKDSTLKQAPSFRVNGGIRDSLWYSTDTTFVTKFNTTSKLTDSLPSTSLLLVKYSNTSSPLTPTDSLRVWPVGYTNYYYDSLGTKVDSIKVRENQKINLTNTPYYDVFEVIHDIEIGRLISPYAKTFPKSFKYNYVFDVTDYASLLKDSVQLRIKYEGYSYGFTSTMDIAFIEGTPVREAYKVVNIYNGGFTYGNPNNSIENALTAKSFTVPNDAKAIKLRVYITGHGGEQNENCAEFCSKKYFLKLDNTTFATQDVWKNDCGKNAIINQPGTWIYNRANWCPGEAVRVFEYPLELVAGSTHTLDMDMQSFIANGNASYNIAVQLVYYKDFAYTLDLGIEDIISPSNNFWFNRLNPICDNAQFIMRNLGKDIITSAEITYRIGNAAIATHTWTGTLESQKSTTVTLPWLRWPDSNSEKIFEVQISKVNGLIDGNTLNNKLTSTYSIPQKLPRKFIIETRTNNRPTTNRYSIKDSRGKVLFNKSFSEANLLHRDTFEFSIGCYTFYFEDDDGNGLSFWATPGDGTGFVRILSAEGPVQVLKNFNGDFGSFQELNFTSEFAVGQQPLDHLNASLIQLYPNPANDIIKIESNTYIIKHIALYTIDGSKVMSSEYSGNSYELSVLGLPAGLYFVEVTDINNLSVMKKIAISK